MDTNNDLELKKSLIKEQPLFSQLTPDECEKLADLFAPIQYKPGDIIVTEGDPVDSIYLIAEGRVEIRQSFIKDGKVETKSITTIGAPEAIGLNETGFYSLSGRRTATVIAVTHVSTFKLSIASFHGFALANSHVSEVMRKNSESINDTH